jgi:hypothetical protein
MIEASGWSILNTIVFLSGALIEDTAAALLVLS